MLIAFPDISIRRVKKMRKVELKELVVVEESVDNGAGFGCFANHLVVGVVCGWVCIGFVCVPW